MPLTFSANRIKTMNNSPIVALMNEGGQLQLIDNRNALNELINRNDKQNADFVGKCNIIKQFLLSDEGFSLDFSPIKLGRLSCGLMNGEINLFNPVDENMSDIQKSGVIKVHGKSVEDIQFSPKEEHVMASCSGDGTIRIFDLRTDFNNISNIIINAHDNCDVNVISWNASRNMIASGGDDGSFKVWDLRFLNKPPISMITWHTEPITSIQWQPHDDWTIAVSSSDNRMSIWDFSVEPDDSQMVDQDNQDIPDQMLFLHQGQEDLKDCKWHPQYKNVIMTTALDGYNVFQPCLDDDLSSIDSPNDMELE